MRRIVVLISGRGANMQAIVEASRSQSWPAEVVAVLSNRPEAAGLAWAREAGLATACVDHRLHPDRSAFDAALREAVDGFEPDLLVLAGFMRILTPEFVRHYEGRLVNVHPSLLPAFAGLHTHRRVLEAGCKVTGATIHFVTADLDHGPIIAQALVPVLADDTEATLADRVLAQERVLYPQALRWWAEGQLQVDGWQVLHRQRASQLLTDGI